MRRRESILPNQLPNHLQLRIMLVSQDQLAFGNFQRNAAIGPQLLLCGPSASARRPLISAIGRSASSSPAGFRDWPER